MQAITNATLFTGEQLLNAHSVVFKRDQIVQIVPDSALPQNLEAVYNIKGDYLIPGFIDLQVNGGGGIMFNSAPTVDTIKTMIAGHRQFGSTGLFPTLITDSFSQMQTAIRAVDEAIVAGVKGVLGIHLEGPFLSPQKRGAHDANKFCTIDAQGIELVSSLKHGKTIVTLAPELTDMQSISKLRERGVIVCAGHSNADHDQTQKAIKAGLSGFTHLFNAMTGLHSRAPGMVGAAITNEETWFGIIADGYHVHPTSLKVAIRAKHTGGAVLVTDAMSTVGSEDDSFVLDGEEIRSVNGCCVNAAGSLAGSDLDMLSAVKNTINYANVSWQEAVRMASMYPSQAAGLAEQHGSIKVGGLANFVQLNSALEIQNTWISGER